MSKDNHSGKIIKLNQKRKKNHIVIKGKNKNIYIKFNKNKLEK